MRHCRPSIGRALLHTGHHFRGCIRTIVRELWRGTYCKGISIQPILFGAHEPVPCCDPHQLSRQYGKHGPRVGALHRLSPRSSNKKYQCSFSAVLRTDVLVCFRGWLPASYKSIWRIPALQVTGLHHNSWISHGRSPNGTLVLKRTTYASCICTYINNERRTSVKIPYLAQCLKHPHHTIPTTILQLPEITVISSICISRHGSGHAWSNT